MIGAEGGVTRRFQIGARKRPESAAPHVATVGLRVTPHDAKTLHAAFHTGTRLYNAAPEEALQRARTLRADPEFARLKTLEPGPDRTAAFQSDGRTSVERNLSAKDTGTFYTPTEVASFLSAVATRKRTGSVLEPCFGEGVFLQAIRDQVSGSPCRIVGVDRDITVVDRVRREFPTVRLVVRDFFDVTPRTIGHFDAVVGNPPFVRYHRFTGSQRALGLNRAKEAGVPLSALTSAWVPFLIHATQHLTRGGRMCVVAPWELTYAHYARPFISYLCENFSSVRVVQSDDPLFPDLNEAVVLLLADGWGGRADSVDMVQTARLSQLNPERIFEAPAHRVPVAQWAAGEGRPSLLRLPAPICGLYRAIEEQSVLLGSIARITIGYVTGANQWFHLSQTDVREGGLVQDVRLALRKGSDLAGLGLWTDADARQSLAHQGAHWLFDPVEPLGDAARRRIDDGARQRVPDRYKCRVRSPWWRVPGVTPHDFVMGVFSTHGPRLVATDLPATNTLLVGDMVAPIPVDRVAAAALTSFAALSAEVVGHVLGGGALKFEPAEARTWALPIHDALPDADLERLHMLMVNGQSEAAQALADQRLLTEGMGLSVSDIQDLKAAVATLRGVRLRRTPPTPELATADQR